MSKPVSILAIHYKQNIYIYILIYNNYMIVNEHFLLDHVFPNFILFYICFVQDIK